jgi:hypothetical protein
VLVLGTAVLVIRFAANRSFDEDEIQAKMGLALERERFEDLSTTS